MDLRRRQSTYSSKTSSFGGTSSAILTGCAFFCPESAFLRLLGVYAGRKVAVSYTAPLDVAVRHALAMRCVRAGGY
jgi:hypothetical protein